MVSCPRMLGYSSSLWRDKFIKHGIVRFKHQIQLIEVGPIGDVNRANQVDDLISNRHPCASKTDHRSFHGHEITVIIANQP